ncbi:MULTISPECIES: acyltransferase family protein [Corynebacterium]|uniref:acyltransferase family protein n=1 Tax=Corynebacterium TaxID=1716 RepID=UPI00124F3257|nr:MULTISPECIES: acyltransferase [Corynebacterium]
MSPQSYATPRGYNPSLEGLRAVAACGVLLTHTSFQSGMDPSSLVGGFLGRFDFFVALFFALSAYLLARGDYRTRRSFYAKRFFRVVPAYVVCVATALIILPANFDADPAAVIATFFFAQIYLPHGLLPGITHLWSMCVEVAFYLVFPFISQKRWIILGLALLSLGWAFIPFPTGGPNWQIFPPAYTCWFAVGLLAARIQPTPTAERWLRRRWIWWICAAAILFVAGQEFFGPLGLEHPSPLEFLRRVIAGAAFAAVVLVPYALAPGSRLLDSRLFSQLGTISYSIFLWHVVVLEMVFPLLGMRPFTGNFLLITAVTLGLTLPVAYLSYHLVERPARGLWRWLPASARARQPRRRAVATDQ